MSSALPQTISRDEQRQRQPQSESRPSHFHHHVSFKAFAKLGKAVKTLFLCRYHGVFAGGQVAKQFLPVGLGFVQGDRRRLWVVLPSVDETRPARADLPVPSCRRIRTAEELDIAILAGSMTRSPTSACDIALDAGSSTIVSGPTLREWGEQSFPTRWNSTQRSFAARALNWKSPRICPTASRLRSGSCPCPESEGILRSAGALAADPDFEADMAEIQRERGLATGISGSIRAQW